ncbi:peptidase M28, partial [Corallococcus sp. CA049B]
MASKINDSSRPLTSVSRLSSQDARTTETKSRNRPLAFKDGFESSSSTRPAPGQL